MQRARDQNGARGARVADQGGGRDPADQRIGAAAHDEQRRPDAALYGTA